MTPAVTCRSTAATRSGRPPRPGRDPRGGAPDRCTGRHSSAHFADPAGTDPRGRKRLGAASRAGRITADAGSTSPPRWRPLTRDDPAGRVGLPTGIRAHTFP